MACAPDETGCVSLALGEVDSLDMAVVLAEVESRMVRWAMTRCRGNLAKAAEMLHIPRSTLQYKLAKIGQSESAPPAKDD